MATQRMVVATIGGDGAEAITEFMIAWRKGGAAEPAQAVDRFCERLRQHGSDLPVVYYTEWVDHWLMGDKVPGPGAVEGRRFHVTCFTPTKAFDWARECRLERQEERWLASRLREAAEAWVGVVERPLIVVVREPLGGLATDEELRHSMQSVPGWLRGE